MGTETFSPVARLETIRTLIALAAQKRWKIFQLDVKSAFLNGKLDEDNYVEQPQGFLMISSIHKTMIQGFKEHMMKAYEMSDLGLLHYFLGVEVTKKPEGILSHKRVVSEKLSKDDGTSRVDNSLYRSLVGSLLYLTATRPDIMFAATLLSRFMQNPSQIHFRAAKRILRYLQGTLDYGIYYKAGENLNLIAYSDSDWARSIDDMKSTSGYAFLRGTNICSWLSKKQKVVAQSSAEAEYVAAGKATT
ncbi:secreted RxLR effector protein 161-like [Apium graveolens]|uniref:secreted RxLR effector protein 161-like n=1 Tax=Apium graveolens TaxID=4045 RepID=UPI003D79BC0D